MLTLDTIDIKDKIVAYFSVILLETNINFIFFRNETIILTSFGSAKLFFYKFKSDFGLTSNRLLGLRLGARFEYILPYF